MRYANAGTAEEHQRAASEAVHEAESNESKGEIDSTRDDDVEHHTADTVTSVAVDLLGVIEDHVDSAPLLKHSQKNTDSEDAQDRRREELISPEAMFGFSGQSRLDLAEGVIGIGVAAYLGQRSARLIALSVLHQPARTFRDQQRAEEKDEGGHCDGREHPSPAELAIPRRSDLLRGCSCGDLL